MASCITILLINIPYFISVTSIILVWWILPDQISFHEIIFAWIPIITSGLNPLIILSRKSDARRAILELINNSWSARKYGVDSIHSNTQSTQLQSSKSPPTPNPVRSNVQHDTIIANKIAGASDV